MKQKIFALLLIVGFTTFLTGCVKTADGHMKAGVPFAKDKIVSRYQRSVDQVMDAARTVLNKNGQIQNDDTASKSFTAKVNNCTVWVKVAAVKGDEKITELVVQVRTKSGGGDIYKASDLTTQIALQLANQ